MMILKKIAFQKDTVDFAIDWSRRNKIAFCLLLILTICILKVYGIRI